MLKRAGLLAAALSLCAAPIAAHAEDCGTIQLGAAVSMTGIYAAHGHNTRDGYDCAVKKINSEGGVTIDGKCYKFEVKYYDDESNPARAAQLVERLIDQDKIQFMLGPYGSPLTTAILPVTANCKTPVVQAAAASRSLLTQAYKN